MYLKEAEQVQLKLHPINVWWNSHLQACGRFTAQLLCRAADNGTLPFAHAAHSCFQAWWHILCADGEVQGLLWGRGIERDALPLPA